jgi:hypothetical protein
MSSTLVGGRSISDFVRVLAVLASCVIAGCGEGGNRIGLAEREESAASAAIWRTATCGTERELLDQLLALAADASRATAPFTNSWGMTEDESIEWMFGDGTVVRLSPARATVIKASLAALDLRADVSPSLKRAAIDRLWQLGERLNEASDHIAPAVAKPESFDALLARFNTLRARSEVRMASIVFRLLAIEALATLPAEIMPIKEIETRKLSVLASRKEFVLGMQESHELQQLMLERISQ